MSLLSRSPSFKSISSSSSSSSNKLSSLSPSTSSNSLTKLASSSSIPSLSPSQTALFHSLFNPSTIVHERCSHIWIRCEQRAKPPRGSPDLPTVVDRRAPLAPEDAKLLIDKGFQVTVESSNDRCYQDNEYAVVGCNIMPPNSWRTHAPLSALIIGLRDFEAPPSIGSSSSDSSSQTDGPSTDYLMHRHVFFSYTFKQQQGWCRSLLRFLRGGGVLFDLEYLTDPFGSRAVSFGYVGGQIAMISACMAWCRQLLGPSAGTGFVGSSRNGNILEHVQRLMSDAIAINHGVKPRIVVIGAHGRCGTGAVAFANQLSMGLEISRWGREQTMGRGPFPSLLKDYDILINCIKLNAAEEVKPFVTKELLNSIGAERRLSVIVDASCDLSSPKNPLPIYQQCTTLTQPTVRIIEGSVSSDDQPAMAISALSPPSSPRPSTNLPLDLIAVPNLCSLLPVESSRAFSAQLTPLLMKLKEEGFQSSASVWRRAAEMFERISGPLRPLPPISKTPSYSQLTILGTASDQANSGSSFGLTDQQKHILHLLKTNKSSVNELRINHAIALKGPVAASAARTAAASGAANLQAIVVLAIRQRHDLLRAKLIDDSRFQLIDYDANTLDPQRFVSLIDLRSEASTLTHDRIDSLIEESYRRPLDISIGASFHVTAFVLPEPHTPLVLSVTFHPLVSDIYSAHIFLHELLVSLSHSLYSLPRSTLQYSDLVAWRRRTEQIDLAAYAESSVANLPASLYLSDRSYLEKLFDDSAPVAQLPTDYTRTPSRSLACRRRNIHLTDSEVNAIADIIAEMRSKALEKAPPRESPSSINLSEKDDAESGDIDTVVESSVCSVGEENAPTPDELYAFFIALMAVIVYRRTRENDLAIDTLSTGRTRYPLRSLLGPLAEQSPLRLAAAADQTFLQFYQHTLARLIDRQSHSEVSFTHFLEYLKKTRGADHARIREWNHIFSNGFSTVQVLLSPYFLATSAPSAALYLPTLPSGLQVFEYTGEGVSYHPYDLSLSVHPSPGDGGMDLSLDYAEALFSSSSADEVLSQIKLLLDQVLSNECRPIGEYSLLTPSALKVLPDPTVSLDADWPGSIVEIFDRNARAHPSRPVIYFENEQYSYGDLFGYTNQLANRLHAAGVGKGDVVALYGHRSPAMAVAIMGVLKSGAAYSPLDPKYPPDRIVTCLQVAQATAFIAIEAAGSLDGSVDEYLNSLPQLKTRLVLPSRTSATLQSGEFLSNFSKESGPRVEIFPDDICVVTFTSGSTGLPKGVQGRHISLTHFYPWMVQRFHLSSSERFSMCSGIAHDPLQRDLFTPLFLGASIHIPTDAIIAMPGALARWFAKEGCTVTCMTPAMLQLLTSDESLLGTLEKLRLGFFVGDLLIKRDVLKLLKLAPNVTCINMYGSTETQRAVGYNPLTIHSDLTRLKEVVPVGKGMEDVQLLLLNERGERCAIGEMGEIYMRSPHLAAGYLGLEKATAEKFLLNPFHPHFVLKNKKDLNTPNKNGFNHLAIRSPTASNHVSASASSSSLVSLCSPIPSPSPSPIPLLPLDRDRLYRTGDLGRYTINGEVECAGRADDQIKIRGFRIELGEINAFLSKHPYVKENVTTVRNRGGPGGEKEIVSFLVVADAAKSDPSIAAIEGKSIVTVCNGAIDAHALSKLLLSFLKQHLPSYMIPSHIVAIPAIPLTPNGKTNVPGLLAIKIPHYFNDDSLNEEKTAALPPSSDENLSELGKKIIQIWRRVMERPYLNPTDSFFESGGHSLMATQLIFALQQEAHLLTNDASIRERFTVANLYACPTIVQFMEKVEGKTHHNGVSKNDDVDLEAEAQSIYDSLNLSADAISSLSPPTTLPHTVLLTGATGFLGTFLLCALLRSLPANRRVICAVRVKSKTAKEAKERVVQSLKAHQLYSSLLSDTFNGNEEELLNSIEGLPADLSVRRLGLDNAAWNDLSQRVECIIHNGAYVHWLLPYQQLKSSNVVSTADLIALAATHRIKPLHYVSTTSVLDGHSFKTKERIFESDALRGGTWQGLKAGYGASKWTAERVIEIAREKLSLPLTVSRPGYISGASDSGVWNTDDFLCRFIKGCIQLGAAPFTDNDFAALGSFLKFDMAPVDWVANTIVSLTLNNTAASSKGSVYHVTHREPLGLSRLFDAIRAAGYPLESLSYSNWRAKLLSTLEKERQQKTEKASIEEKHDDTQSNALTAIASQFSPSWPLSLRNPVFDQSSLCTALPSIQFPVMPSIVSRYIDYLHACGFLDSSGKIGDTKVERLTRSNRT